MVSDADLDTSIRTAAFAHVSELCRTRDHLGSHDLAQGFLYRGERIPLINPRRGIFKPRQMKLLLSIKTVFPKPGGRVWYDDQREVHRQITATRAPSAKNCFAVSRPMPLVPPVTKARFPGNLLMFDLQFLRERPRWPYGEHDLETGAGQATEDRQDGPASARRQR